MADASRGEYVVLRLAKDTSVAVAQRRGRLLAADSVGDCSANLNCMAEGSEESGSAGYSDMK